MKKSAKALLWSGLVFPGAGHFSLRRFGRGMLFFVPALAASVVLVRGVIVQAEFVMDKIQNGTMPLDPQAIETVLDATPETLATRIAFWLLIACWAAGMADAYRLGAAGDNEGGAPQ